MASYYSSKGDKSKKIAAGFSRDHDGVKAKVKEAEAKLAAAKAKPKSSKKAADKK